MSRKVSRKPTEKVAPAITPVTPKTYICVHCTTPIEGNLVGAGDGSGESFSHEVCYWRERALDAEAELRRQEFDRC